MHAIGFGPRIVVNRPAQRASLDLAGFDFSGGILPAGARLTRASVATHYDATGKIVSVTENVARFDRDPVTLARRGLLIEPAGSNGIARSVDWTDGYWLKSALDVGTAALIEATGSGTHALRQVPGDLAYTAGQPFSLSVIASERAGSAKRFLLISIGGAPAFTTTIYAIFDLADGSATLSGNGIATTSPAGASGWLCTLTATAVATATAQQIVLRLNSSATALLVHNGDGASGLNVSHVQVEPGSVATSRIVTAGSAATRAADVLVLDWRSRGVADGTIGVRYRFDDGSSQDVATVVAGGLATVPTTLARRWVRRADKL